jgi:hypothetical protein
MATYKHLRPEDIPPVPTAAELVEELKNCSFEDLADRMYELEVALENMDAARAPFAAAYEIVRKQIIPAHAENSGSSVLVRQFTSDYRGRVQLQSDLYVQVLSPQEAQQWLQDNGHGDLIKPSVHAGSLKAAMKRRIQTAQGTPPEDLFKLTPFKFAMITRA